MRFGAPRRRRWWLVIIVGILLLAGLAAGGVAVAFWYIAQDVPSLDTLESRQPSLVTRVYSDDHQIIGQFYVERRILTPIAEVPKHLVDAVIAVEDARFFEHPGLDVIGIMRAFYTNLRRGGRVEGASTITQQLARSLFLSSERTYSRKFKELILAYKMELVLSKEQILEMYLNQIYFGQGAYGIRTAALTYFGKDLSDVTLAEAALLAGLPKSPNNYSPFKSPERAKKRQEHVLARMEEAGFITVEEHLDASAEPLTLRRAGAEQIAPYFVEHVRQLLVAKYGEAMVYKGGLEVYTTLNVAMQKAAEAAVRKGLHELDKRQGWRGPLRLQPSVVQTQTTSSQAIPEEGAIVEAVVTKIAKDHVAITVNGTAGKLSYDDMAWARRKLRGRDLAKDVTLLPSVKTLLKPGDVIEVTTKREDRDAIWYALEQTPIVEGGLIAIDPRNGAIKAMVGGYDFARSEFNRAVAARRQPGSAFKPLIYATAFSTGFGPASVVVDAPVVYEQPEEEKIWKPENYERKFHGVTTLRDALIHSRNLATVRLLERVGVRNVIEFAKTLGITSPLSPDLSLALGSSSVTLMELTAAYGAFANQGLRLEPYAVAMVQSSAGESLEQTLHEPQPVVSKETAYLITNVLQDVIQRGTGQAAKIIERPVAGKTGTTNDFSDAWFIGYTPNLATGVWVGFDDLRSLGETESGAHAALPIWLDYMLPALEQLPVMPFEIPEEIVFVRVDPKTGLLTPDQGDQGTVEMFAKGSEPTQTAVQRSDPAFFYSMDQIGEAGGPGQN